MRTSYWCTYQRHCADAGTRVTGGRTSGIVECWDPRYWCSYQRLCVNAGPKCWKQERAPPAGRPTRRLAGAVPKNGHQVWEHHSYFLTRQVPSSLSRWSSTRCRRKWYDDQLGLTSIARCPRSWLLSPYHVLIPSPFPSLVARLFGFLALGIPLSSEVTNRLGPLPLFLRLPWVWMIFIPYFHRREGRARTVPRRCTVAHLRPFRPFGVSRAGVLTRSGCGCCGMSLSSHLRDASRRVFPQFLNVASRVSREDQS